jgi:hypothetical protein
MARVRARPASGAVAASWTRRRSGWQPVRFVARSRLLMGERAQRLLTPDALLEFQGPQIVWAFALPWRRLLLRLAVSARMLASAWTTSQTKVVSP